MEEKRQCEYCGKEFVARDRRNVFCCKQCKDNASKVRRGIQPTVFRKKICLCCGKEFETQYSRKQFCNRKCKGRSRKPQIEKVCVICGKTFLTYWNNQVTCGDEECKNTQTLIRRYRNKDKASKLIQYEFRECKECGELFSVDSRMNNVYCSKDCRRKAANRRSDKRIPKEQIVDTDISLKRLFKRDNGICWICGKQSILDDWQYSKTGKRYPGDNRAEIDHVIPVSRGGLHSWNNVRIAHHKCNHDKSDSIYPYVPLEMEFAYKEKRTRAKSKKTAQYTLDGELVKIWESTAAIEREHKEWKCKHIQNVCRRADSKTGNAYGYHWEYVKDDKCK